MEKDVDMPVWLLGDHPPVSDHLEALIDEDGSLALPAHCHGAAVRVVDQADRLVWASYVFGKTRGSVLLPRSLRRNHRVEVRLGEDWIECRIRVP